MKAKGKRRISMMLGAGLVSAMVFPAMAEPDEDVIRISVDTEGETKEISPYIYGINTGVDLNTVTAEAIRMGGNRMTAYNWENNVSNAGSDWYHTSDGYMTQGVDWTIKDNPGAVALDLSIQAQKHEIPYTLLTLQMQGYVAASASGKVPEEGIPGTEYWKQVKNHKDGEFSLIPDTEDDAVYMDEYLNYLIRILGDSQTETGIKAYALDNEPALWAGTHSRIQTTPLTCETLVEKTIDLARTVKEMDPRADVFGPALYGYMAYVSLQGAPDWENIKAENDYRWFIDYYLDQMKKAEEEAGSRLVDVLDLHYYTEAKGACGERSCNHYDNDECIRARLDSTRSLFEENYKENSWIMDTGAEFFPLLPNVKQSIDQYYPGTKLAFTEYNFGGGDHISGAVAEADTLGIFAENDVYFASLWSFDENAYQMAAINMFTNYDGNGSGFGNLLIPSESSDRNLVSSYASLDSEAPNVVRVILTNKSIHEETPVELTLSADTAYDTARIYTLSGESTEIREGAQDLQVQGNVLKLTLEPLSVTQVVIVKGEMPPATEADETDTEHTEEAPDKETQSTSRTEASEEETVPASDSGRGLPFIVIGGIGAAAVLICVTAGVLSIRRRKS